MIETGGGGARMEIAGMRDAGKGVHGSFALVRIGFLSWPIQR